MSLRTKQELVDYISQKNTVGNNIVMMKEKIYGVKLVDITNFQHMTLDQLRVLQDETILEYNEAIRQDNLNR